MKTNTVLVTKFLYNSVHKESILLLSSVISVATFQFQLQTFRIKLESMYESNNK